MQAASLLGKLSIRTVAAAGQPSDSALAAPVNRYDWHTHRHAACAAPTTCVFFSLSKSFFCRVFSCYCRHTPVDGMLRVLNVCVCELICIYRKARNPRKVRVKSIRL